MRPFLVIVAALSIPFSSAELLAQARFSADLGGDLVVPPVSTPSGGFSNWSLQTDQSLQYHIRTWGIQGVGARLMDGDAGVEGSLVFDLEGGPIVWSGTTPPLSKDQVARLLDNGLYVTIDSLAFPDGEVRGPLQVGPKVFAGRGDGGDLVPPRDGSVSAYGEFTIHPDRTLTYSVVSGGTFVGTEFRGGIFEGGVGENGGLLVDFGPSSIPAWSGVSAPLSSGALDAIQNNGSHMVIASNAFPDGEARAQIVTSALTYGSGCPGSVGEPVLSGAGRPMAGDVWRMTLLGATPSSPGLLAISLSDGAALSGSCPYLLGGLATTIAVTTDIAGHYGISPFLPTFGGSFELYIQFWGFDPLVESGVYSSNGLVFPYTSL